jgi:hypothetical protein
MAAKRTALDVLAEFHSWQLNRVSTTTYPHDVVVTARRQGHPLSDSEAKSVAHLMRHGTCYRCRIGKGRYYFGDSPLEAARRAAAAEKSKSAKAKG